jgi:hypothetical protein
MQTKEPNPSLYSLAWWIPLLLDLLVQANEKGIQKEAF